MGMKDWAKDAVAKGLTGEDYLVDVLGMSTGAHTLRRDAATLDEEIAQIGSRRDGMQMEECNLGSHPGS